MDNPLLYFVEGRASVVEAQLTGLGLPHLFDCGMVPRQVSKGPGGPGGCVFWPKPKGFDGSVRVGYWPGEQVWVELPEVVDSGQLTVDSGEKGKKGETRPRVFVGWFREFRPGPESLRRPVGLEAERGYSVPLADGQRWTFTPAQLLPRVWGLEGGEFSRQPDPAHRAHYESCAWLLDFESCSEGRDFAEVAFHISRCLGMNYRVGLGEVLALGLLSDSVMHLAAAGCIGMEDFRAAAEKKTSGGGDGGPGSGD